MSPPPGWQQVIGRIAAAAKALAVKLRSGRVGEPMPAMIGIPPSARQVPADAAEHAADFAERYAESMDYLVSQRMMDLGIPVEQIGASAHNIPHAAFWPHERTGGGNVPGPRYTVDSGVFNPELMSKRLKAGPVWAKSRLRDRIDAIIAHEVAESQTRDHLAAEAMAPDTPLPITERARHLLRVIREGSPGR
jgi:hypothetical protein